MKLLISLLFLIPVAYLIKIENLPGQPKVHFNQYSGYLDVGKNKHHHIHYWFVESQSNPKTDPLLLWLNGGPGCSSLLGLLGENGPFTLISNTEMKLNPYSWNLNASVLYLESPANGVGYSYTDDPKDIYTNDTQTATESWEALREFFKQFPEYVNRDFYVTGESYAGIYIPHLVNEILNRQDEYRINLKGMAIGNGGMNPASVDRDYQYYYGHAMIDENVWDAYLSACCNGNPRTCVPQNQLPNCHDMIFPVMEQAGRAFIDYDVYNMYTKCDAPTGRPPVYLRSFNEVEKLPECGNLREIKTYLNRADIRAVLGIPKQVDRYAVCNDAKHMQFLNGLRETYDLYKRAIDDGIKTMIYYGDFDLACNILPGMRFAKRLMSQPDKNVLEWYKVDGLTAGKWMHEENLRFVTVRASGHMVPTDQPVVAKHILDKFISWQPLSDK